MTPPPRRCSVFGGGTPPRKRPAPHPCPSGRTKTAPLSRRAALSFCLDAGRTTHAATRDAPSLDRPARITEYLRKDKRAREKVEAPPFLCRRLHPPGACSRPAFRSFRACRRHRPPETPGPPGPFRARARGRSGEASAPQTAGFSAPQTVLRLRKNYGKPGRRTALHLRFEVKGRMPAGPFRAFRKRPPRSKRGKSLF